MSTKPIHHLIQKYALAISFLTLLCMVITLGIALFDIVQITAPQFTYVPQENYVVSETSNPTMGDTPAINVAEESARSIRLEKMNAARSLTQAIIILIIDIALFIYHWKLANRPVQGALVSA